MQVVTPILEIAELVAEFGGESLHVCMQCGTCTAVCPWNLVGVNNPRVIMRQISLGFEGCEGEDLWRCVTCNTCVARCPRGVEIIDVLRAARTMMNAAGSVPPNHKGALASLHSDGNPWQGDRSERVAVAAELGLPELTDDHEYLYFTCCSQTYDPRNKKAAKALARLLDVSGVSFGVRPEAEVCCGDQARKVGAQDVFDELAEENAELLGAEGVTKVLTASPHCLNVINKDYAEAEVDLGVKAEHYTEVLERALDAGQLTPTVEVTKKVAYHDPCYLGRHNGIYDAPRNLLDAIPGLTRVELRRNRENSLCCGGGGGGIWADVPTEERFAVVRVREALEVGAEVIATACPYCTSMLEDAVKVLDLEDRIEIQDVAELLAESVE